MQPNFFWGGLMSINESLMQCSVTKVTELLFFEDSVHKYVLKVCTYYVDC